MPGSHFRAPLSVKLLDGSSVTIVNSAGEVTGAITPESFTADQLITAAYKWQFRDTGIYIHSAADGKITISADGAGADDITLEGGVTITSTLAVTGAVALAAAVTMATNVKIQFRDTGIFINSGADGKLTISADGAGADDITLSGTVTLDDNVTQATDKKFIFRSTGIYINSPAAGKLQIVADGGGADDITLSGGVTISGSVAMTGTFTLTGALVASVGVQAAAVARTATADGTGTGTIADNTSHVTVTSDDANKIIVLPTPTPGRKVTIFVGATGFELRSSAPATVSINGGAGASAESAIGANVVVHMTCVSATAWTGFQQSSDGTLAAVEAAA